MTSKRKADLGIFLVFPSGHLVENELTDSPAMEAELQTVCVVKVPGCRCARQTPARAVPGLPDASSVRGRHRPERQVSYSRGCRVT